MQRKRRKHISSAGTSHQLVTPTHGQTHIRSVHIHWGVGLLMNPTVSSALEVAGGARRTRNQRAGQNG
jgi:hypothetical protein